MGRRALGVAFGGSVTASQTLEFSSTSAPDGRVEASQQATFLHASFEGFWRWGKLTSVWSLGPELQISRIAGDSLPLTASTTLANLGGRVGLGLRWPLGNHVQLLAQGVLGLFPHQYDLQVENLTTAERETIGKTALFSPRASLGLGYRW